MKAKYQDRGGDVVEIFIERHEWNQLAMSNPSFNFLKDEPDIYTEVDIIESE